MGRGRGKGKKQSAIAARDDVGSGEDEKIPSRRRGRPQKPLKDEFEEEDEVKKIEEEEENGQDSKSSGLNRSTKNLAATEKGRKRIRPSQVNENADLVKEENGVGIKTNASDLIKSVGFRPNRSRRKNKPRRAAEVGVECK
ncbi:uncharacterized protein LOC111392749 isoform X2 [Olea europaea var. sylvestris]|uniref:uncharacterized protein LOC111392749 isoform X2 n=1 Tax=Olea europaea var. sylvestris TaxID=158386 RepID=UPI000C1D6032|nr:uncharacterized protein LOC111392749 isoform X2 [Olea europaea var. sylvestris]XP_022873914.1 uncharacterized protein LOC111392749 isoform X2 [Olea europaea var. sylvestris]